MERLPPRALATKRSLAPREYALTLEAPHRFVNSEPVHRAWQGLALETLMYHEMRVCNETSRKYRAITYYRTAAGEEVDFIVETGRRSTKAKPRIATVVVKRSETWRREWKGPLRSLAAQQGVTVEKMIAVYTGSQSYRFDDLDVWPVERFIHALHDGEVF